MSSRQLRIVARFLAVCLDAPCVAQTTLRISYTTLQTSAGTPSISADGRYVVYEIINNQFVHRDVYVHDRHSGTTAVVSPNSNGDNAAGRISTDGRFVAYDSTASSIDPGDTNGVLDVYLRDLQGGTNVRVSLDSSGNQANGLSYLAGISADGRFVVFQSQATNLVPGDTNGSQDVFIRDLQAGSTDRVCVDSSGAQANLDSQGGSVSADGRFVAFQSLASNLVAGDTNGSADIFVRDRQNGTTQRVSVDSNGAQAVDQSYLPTLSADGGYVVFTSRASNLVPGDTNAATDVFLRDLSAGTTELVSQSSSSVLGNAHSGWHWPQVLNSVSSDGRYVAFESLADNLVAGDTNGIYDIFLRDRQLGTTERVSLGSTGGQSDADSDSMSITDDGRFIAFDTFAGNLVPFDLYGRRDVYLRDRTGGAAVTNLCEPGLGGVIGCPCSNAPSGSGRGCDNSAATGGASLSATGTTYLSYDTLVFTTGDERPTALSLLLQGTAFAGSGVVYGQGVRCVGGTLKRLYTKTAAGGSITAPDFGAGDPRITARSAAKGDPISAGQSRWYLVFYRDPIVLGGCPAGSTFNATQTARAVWSP